MLVIVSDKLRDRYHLNTERRLNWFYTHLQFHTDGYTLMNLEYKFPQMQLMKKFPLLFPTKLIAHRYEYKEDRIASRIYADMRGNSNEKSKDGFTYRHRGFFKILGRFEYEMLSEDLRINFANNPDLLFQKKYAFQASMWFWSYKKLYQYADNDNILGVLLNLNDQNYDSQGIKELYEYISFMQFSKNKRGGNKSFEVALPRSGTYRKGNGFPTDICLSQSY